MKKPLKKYLIILGVLVALFSIYTIRTTPLRPAMNAVKQAAGEEPFFPVLADPIRATFSKFHTLR